MFKAHNILFSIATALLFCALYANVAAEIVIPGYEMQDRTYLEGRTLRIRPNISVASVISGDFQRGAEKMVSDCTPMREDILMMNAALQRVGIESANAFFNFKSYSAYYGADNVLCTEWNSVAERPRRQENEPAEHLKKVAEICNDLMATKPNTQWALALVDRSRASLANPAHDLVSKPADYLYYLTHFASELDDSCHFIDLHITETDEYYRQFFRTDHHWQIQGAYAAYSGIVQAFGIQAMTPARFFSASDKTYVGSLARGARFEGYKDVLDDIEFTPGNLVITRDGKKEKISYLNASYADDYAGFKTTTRFGNYYAWYYHGDPGLLTIVNEDVAEGTLLIIGDSYTDNMERLFTQHYHTVHVIDPRFYKGSIPEFIQETTIDNACFIFSGRWLIEPDAYEPLMVKK